MKNLLMKLHYSITEFMAKLWIVEHILIAKFTDDNGETYDCIYCTILRNAVLFFIVGLLVGLFAGYYVGAK